MTLTLPKGASTPVTVALSKSAATRLRKKGGSLQVTVQTALSSPTPVTQTVMVKRGSAKGATRTTAKH